MDIYNYDSATGIYLGASVSDPDPLDPENRLLPAFSTTIEPPVEITGYDRVFVDAGWQYALRVDPLTEPIRDPMISENLVRVESARRLELLARPYTAAERETWSTQVNEAEALIANPAANAPLLTRRSVARGMSPVDYAVNVLAKEEAFAAASGDILAAQDILLALSPIPTNYDDDAHWP